MYGYMLQEMANQRIKDLHREARAHRLARLARGRKKGSYKPPEAHRSTLNEAQAA